MRLCTWHYANESQLYRFVSVTFTKTSLWLIYWIASSRIHIQYIFVHIFFIFLYIIITYRIYLHIIFILYDLPHRNAQRTMTF